jgi:hypothetical protein
VPASQGINTDRLIRDPVLAESGVPFDHLAMDLEGLAHGESQLGVAGTAPVDKTYTGRDLRERYNN